MEAEIWFEGGEPWSGFDKALGQKVNRAFLIPTERLLVVLVEPNIVMTFRFSGLGTNLAAIIVMVGYLPLHRVPPVPPGVVSIPEVTNKLFCGVDHNAIDFGTVEVQLLSDRILVVERDPAIRKQARQYRLN